MEHLNKQIWVYFLLKPWKISLASQDFRGKTCTYSSCMEPESLAWESELLWMLSQWKVGFWKVSFKIQSGTFCFKQQESHSIGVHTKSIGGQIVPSLGGHIDVFTPVLGKYWKLMKLLVVVVYQYISIPLYHHHELNASGLIQYPSDVSSFTDMYICAYAILLYMYTCTYTCMCICINSEQGVLFVSWEIVSRFRNNPLLCSFWRRHCLMFLGKGSCCPHSTKVSEGQDIECWGAKTMLIHPTVHPCRPCCF